MFDTLSDRLGSVFDKLRGKGALGPKDVDEALREVRRALLEADVALPVAKKFIEAVRERAVGHEVLKSVTPGQQVVKIVHDTLVDTLGREAAPISLATSAPVVIMMVGLQGSGKTTSTAKIARRLTQRDKQKVMMASLDVQRPAAQEQLRVLGEQVEVKTLPIVAGQQPVAIAKRAMEAARLGGFDVVMLDTAGRLHVDEALMSEMAEIRDVANPFETLLVADSLTGQDAVNVAEHFQNRIGLTGIMLTRVDGDGRGGAALSMRSVTGVPIKLLGTGEKIDELEDFDPERVAGRILGMGDVVSLVEKAAETIDAAEAEKMAAKMKKGQFDLDDMAMQLAQMSKMGGMQGVLGMMPGMGKMKKAIDGANLDDKIFLRQGAIISSMTKKERRNPKLLNASRKKRVAAGSGTTVPEINKLLKMHRQMADMMKKLGKGGKGLGGLMGGLTGAMGLGGGGMPAMGGGMPSDPAEAEAMLKQVEGQLPPGMGLGGNSIAGGGLPGLGGPGGLPGLPGGKKKR
ncbi:MAG: signal recognition particle subunit SRP54 [Parvibaculaceae bacterium]|jgi:signal recognition particle subunit SRP54